MKWSKADLIYLKKLWNKTILRITNGIRCAANSAARGSKNTSRAYALCGVFSHPHSSPPLCFAKLYKVGWNVVYLERYVQFCPTG